jgi:hypothetical protein
MSSGDSLPSATLLREYPQRFYRTSGERFYDVGKRGERAIEII